MGWQPLHLDSTQREHTMHRTLAKSRLGFKSGFLDLSLSGSGCPLDHSQNVVNSFLCVVGHFAWFRQLTVWEMLINLLQCHILQWWGSGKVILNPDHHGKLILPTGRPNHNTKFQWNRLITFSVVLHTDRQTHKHTDYRWHNLLQQN